MSILSLHAARRALTALMSVGLLSLPVAAQDVDLSRAIPGQVKTTDAPSSSARPTPTDGALAPVSSGAPLEVTTLESGSASVRLDQPDAQADVDRLDDVLARERAGQASGLDLARQVLTGGGRNSSVTDGTSAAPEQAVFGPLMAQGGHNDATTWAQIRNGTADDLRVSSRGPAASTLIQDGGMTWLKFREGPLAHWGGWLLVGTLGLLLVFYLLRGRIRLQEPATGLTIQRFAFVERFGHWLIAGSFILLALTGLFLLFGRIALIPLFGNGIYAPIAQFGKIIHTSVSWAFMLGLVMVFVMWVAHNIPSLTDLKWLAKGGGMFSKNTHVHAKKFNAGQKIVFWSVILLGISISLSGLSLIFPFQFHLFAGTFGFLNDLGLPQAVGLGALPTDMAPHHEMQLAQAWHSIIAFLFIAIILGHIYIGTVGMEGAYDAMGSGEVDTQWAREHHDLWYEDVTGRDASMPPPVSVAKLREGPR